MKSDRIADELRARITSGELSPGDLLPSARQIQRQWGVAIATATRVHARLRADGLAETAPGIGVVVRRPPKRRMSPGPHVDRLVRTAVLIADAEGLEAVTMRRLGAELGVSPITLYRYVADKDDLLERMLDMLLRGWAQPSMEDAGWRDCLEASARGLWTILQAHPWAGASLSLTRPQVISGGLAWTERILTVLGEAGLSPQQALDVHLSVFSYVRGLAIALDAETQARAASGQDAEQWINRQQPALRAALGPGLRMFTRLVEEGYDFSLDRLFERGLTLMLDGLEPELVGAPGGSA